LLEKFHGVIGENNVFRGEKFYWTHLGTQEKIGGFFRFSQILFFVKFLFEKKTKATENFENIFLESRNTILCHHFEYFKILEDSPRI